MVSLLLLVFEFRGLKERGTEAEEISIIEYLVGKILFLIYTSYIMKGSQAKTWYTF